MARTDPPFKIRMPAELKERVQEAARFNDRSMNAEILHRIRESLDREDAAMRERPPRRPLNLAEMGAALSARPPVPAPASEMALPQLVPPQSMRELAALLAETLFRKLEEGSRPGETPAERLERLMQITQEERAPESTEKASGAEKPASTKQAAPAPKKAGRRTRA